MWSVAYVAFTGPMEAGTSWLLIFLLFFNGFIQLFFLNIVRANLIEFEVGDATISDLKSWRVNVAHSVEYYDANYDKSLARRVCDTDAGLETSATQSDAYDTYKSYAGAAIDASFLAPGPSMCFVALTVWVLTIAGETNSIWANVRALYYSPTAPRTTVAEHDEGEYSFTALSRSRKFSVGFVLLVRSAICLALLWCGCLFLTVTIDMTDLLLNTVALEFVLGVDELIFSSLAPTKAQAYVDSHRGHAVPRPAAWKGIGVRTLVTMGSCVSLVGFLMYGVVLPNLEHIVEARDALCAGDRDFVIGEDGFGVPVWSFPAWIGDPSARPADDPDYRDRNYPDGGDVPYAQPDFSMASNYGSFSGATVNALVRQLGRVPEEECCYKGVCGTQGPGSACIEDDGSLYGKPWADAPGCCLVAKTFTQDVVGTDYSVGTKSEWTVPEAAAIWNPMCYDVLDLGLPYNQQLAAAVGDTVDSGPCGGCPANAPACVQETGECITPVCADLADYCQANTKTGKRARQLCPNTCGCNDPTSPLALFAGEQGCGDQCRRSGVYTQLLDELPCEDVAADDANFLAFLDDAAAVAQTWPSDWAGGLSQWVAAPSGILRAYGCAALDGTAGVPAYSFGSNPCVEEGWWFGVKPLSYFCPVACACYSGDPHCPTSCPARNGTEPDCPAYQKQYANSFPESTSCALAAE